MPLASLFHRVIARTRVLVAPLRYGATVAVVAATFGLRALLDPVWPSGYPFLIAMAGILVSALLFTEGCGLLATALSALAAMFLYLPPTGTIRVDQTSHLVALGFFVLLGTVLTLVIETLHHAMEHLKVAERRRAMQLREFRHRTRNDLSNLVGLLLLRARGTVSDETRASLKEAAAHAMALARVHTRLAAVESDAADEAVVDSRAFVVGLVHDIKHATGGDGLLPVALVVEAVSVSISTERAVHLGLVVNECATNALKYAFPGERHGVLRVVLERDVGDFVLVVADDGVGLGAGPVSPGLGTRLLRGLAAQLQGVFVRAPAPGGGTLCTLRFPIIPRGAKQPIPAVSQAPPD